MFIGLGARQAVIYYLQPRKAWLLATVCFCGALAGCEPVATSSPAGKTGSSPAETSDAAPPPASPAADAKPQEAKAAPAVDLQIKDYEGIQALIESHRGKVVVMDAWSTWCEPCIKEFPGLVALHKKYGPEKVACISLNFNFEGLKREKPEDHRDEVLGFLTEQGATFDNLISNEPAEALYKKLELSSVPAVFVFDREGELAKRYDGNSNKERPFSYADVDALVEKLLAP